MDRKMSLKLKPDGHIIPIDAEEANGGENKGPDQKFFC